MNGRIVTRVMRRLPTSPLLGLLCAASVAIGAAGQRGGGPPAVPAPGQNAAPQPPPVLKLGSSLIVGKVVEAGTTTGVAGAVVTLIGPALGPSNAMFSNGVQGGPRRITADAQGQFLFRDLPAGAYNIASSAVGYVIGSYGQTRVTQFQRPLDLPRSLEVTETDKVLTVSISMSRNGGIGGTVVDETGEPMVGAPVTVLTRGTEWGAPVMQIAADVTTDDRGIYHADVAPGDYIVGLIAATTTIPVSAVDGFQQAQREGGATMQAYMNQIVASGSLLPRGVGARVGNFMVSQFGRQNSWVVPPIRSEDGRALFYPTTFHPSSPSGTSASLVTVASGEEKTGIDVHLRPVPARRGSGRVVDSSGPVAGIALRLIAPDASSTGSGIWFVTGDTPQALTNGSGEFTFLGIAPGSYTVRVLRASTPADPVLWAADQITVGADADVADLTVRLQPGATIAGRVVIDGNGLPPPLEALRAIGIRPTPLPGSAGSLMGPIGWLVRPDQNGRFTTGQMVPGPYIMAITGVPSGWMVKSVTAGGENAVDKPFELPASGVADIVVTLIKKESSLSGTARDDNGQPVPAATVVAFPVDKALWPPPGLASSRIRTAAPGRDGRFTFRALPAGDYFVAAVDGRAADFSDSRVWAALTASASRVTINDGESKTQDLRVTVMR